jgi:hypothetical protein
MLCCQKLICDVIPARMKAAADVVVVDTYCCHRIWPISYHRTSEMTLNMTDSWINYGEVMNDTILADVKRIPELVQ